MKIAPEAPKIELGKSGHAVLRAYLLLFLVGGHVGLPLALATMFASRTASRRYPTLINMLISWIVFASAALILFYSGEYQSRQPDFGRCLAQASLMYGATVMVASATLCLVLQLWIDLRGRTTAYISFKGKVLLVGLPWLVLVLVVVFVASYGAINTSTVSYRWLFYCTISSNAVVWIVSGLTLISIAAMFCFQISVIRTLYRVSRQIRGADRSSYNMSLRISLFAIYTIVTFIIFGVNVLIPELIFPYIFVSTLPLTAFAIFGTTKENVTIWTQCLRRQPHNEVNDAIRLESMAFKAHQATSSSAGATSTINSTKVIAKVLPTQPESTTQLLPVDGAS